tara:strand:- start:120763 stop:121806 length:1044 start_codon:yes stop_codon:yes gene_type:complete
MSEKVIKFPKRQADRDQILEQACGWLAKLDGNKGCSVELREQIKQWLAEDPDHVQALLQMAELWDQMSALSELSEIFPLEQKARRSFAKPGLLAAGLALFFIALVFAPGLFDETVDAPLLAGEFSYSTQVGEQSEVDLPDGSEMILNTNTSINVIYSESERRIYLDHGEGLFKVAKNAARPFRVYAGSRIVEAVGTAFSVQHLENGSVEIVVTEGEVKVLPVDIEASEQSQRGNGEFNMLAGNFAVTSNDIDLGAIELRRLEVSEIEAKLAWQHGMLLFEGEPLDEVLKEIGRYTTIQFDIDNAINQIKVEGYFQASDIEGVLMALENNFNIAIDKINENQFYLRPL